MWIDIRKISFRIYARENAVKICVPTSNSFKLIQEKPSGNCDENSPTFSN